MSDIIIRGMDMSKNCAECERWDRCKCVADFEDFESIYNAVEDGDLVRDVDCPLIPLPDKHGRLVDLDKLCNDLLERWHIADKRKEEIIRAVMADVVTPIIACQPTIIDAERSGE